LFTSTAIAPMRARIASIAWRSASMSVRSHDRNSGAWRTCARRSASAAPAAASRSTNATRAPCSAKCSTNDAPMPVAPPVISTARSSRLG